MNSVDRWRKARFKLLQTYPFFALIAQRFQFVKTEAISTTAVNEKGEFFFNEEHTEGLSDTDMVFEIGHEAGHVVFNHITRARPEIRNNAQRWSQWNYAGDIVIDSCLVLKMKRSFVSQKAIADSMIDKYKGWTTERVFEDLLKNPPPQTQQSQQGQGQQGQGQQGQGQQGQGQQGQGQKGQGQPRPKPGLGGRDCCTGGFHTMDESTETEWQQAIIQSAQTVMNLGEGQGHLPGAVIEFMQKLIAPQIKWTDVLRQMLIKGRQFDASWMRPGRRSQGASVRLPTYVRRPVPDVAILCDTSGSITDEFIQTGLSEAYYVMKSFRTKDLHLYLHDVPCYFGERMSIDDLMQKKIKVQRGGTSHIDVFEKALATKPKIIISFTDLITTFPKNPGIPVIWVVPEGYAKTPAPFGKIMETKIK